MTFKEAYQILGLPPGANLHEIKKKYRELIMQAHPDTDVHIRHRMKSATPPPTLQDTDKCMHSAQDITLAYSILKAKRSSDKSEALCHNRNQTSKKKAGSVWNAPVNQNAYAEREILQYAEDSEGTVLGNFCIARGKYMWTTDEDFSLFLLSMYRCSKQLLDETDALLRRAEAPASRPSFQAELTYLLTQQFIAGTDLLTELAQEEKPRPDRCRIFRISSMLEPTNRSVVVNTGESLYPSEVRRHRLYVTDQAGREIGYLSFPDDRLYYVIVPLFEQKRVQVRIRTAEKQPEKKTAGYRNLDLWLKLCDETGAQLPENLNLQIKQLLEQYKTG